MRGVNTLAGLSGACWGGRPLTCMIGCRAVNPRSVAVSRASITIAASYGCVASPSHFLSAPVSEPDCQPSVDKIMTTDVAEGSRC